MVIGDRVVVGDIKERQQARAIYEQAKRARPEGGADRAGAAEHLHQLGRQYRPRRNRAGADRISGAGAAIRQRVLAARAAGGRRRATIRRRSCRASTSRPTAAAGARPDPIRCRTATASRRRCSIRASNAPVNPTSITVRLQAGFPLGEVKSHHHAVKIESPDDSTRIIKLAEGPVPADRDFELTWKPAAEKAPSVGLFREHVGDADYLLAFVTPPSVEQAAAEAAAARGDLRDRQFRLDGRHLDRRRPRRACIYALGRLQPADRFNVIRFDDTMDVLFPDAVPADARACRRRPRRSSARCRRAAAPRWCRRCARR